MAFKPPFAAAGNATRIGGRNGLAALQVRSNVQPLFNYHEPSRHRRFVPGDESVRRQPASDAWRIP
jgi:hypothetical protein